MKTATQQNFVITHNTKITDDFHTTDIIRSFADRKDAINYVTDMNCDMREFGNYNWYSFLEVEVN